MVKSNYFTVVIKFERLNEVWSGGVHNFGETFCSSTDGRLVSLMAMSFPDLHRPLEKIINLGLKEVVDYWIGELGSHALLPGICVHLPNRTLPEIIPSPPWLTVIYRSPDFLIERLNADGTVDSTATPEILMRPKGTPPATGSPDGDCGVDFMIHSRKPHSD